MNQWELIASYIIVQGILCWAAIEVGRTSYRLKLLDYIKNEIAKMDRPEWTLTINWLIRLVTAMEKGGELE